MSSIKPRLCYILALSSFIIGFVAAMETSSLGSLERRTLAQQQRSAGNTPASVALVKDSQGHSTVDTSSEQHVSTGISSQPVLPLQNSNRILNRMPAFKVRSSFANPEFAETISSIINQADAASTSTAERPLDSTLMREKDRSRRPVSHYEEINRNWKSVYAAPNIASLPAGRRIKKKVSIHLEKNQVKVFNKNTFKDK
jgi:hypothetical protein